MMDNNDVDLVFGTNIDKTKWWAHWKIIRSMKEGEGGGEIAAFRDKCWEAWTKGKRNGMV